MNSDLYVSWLQTLDTAELLAEERIRALERRLSTGYCWTLADLVMQEQARRRERGEQIAAAVPVVVIAEVEDDSGIPF